MRRPRRDFLIAWTLYTAGWVYGLAVANGNSTVITEAAVLGVVLSGGLLVAAARWTWWPRWVLIFLAIVLVASNAASGDLVRLPVVVLSLVAIVVLVRGPDRWREKSSLATEERRS